MIHSKLFWAIFGLVMAGIFTIFLLIPNSSNAFGDTDCIKNGDCEAVCGPQGVIICTGMDCGQGTQICGKYIAPEEN